MPGGEIAEKLAVGAQGLGAGAAAWFIYKTFVFLCTFIAARWDASSARATEREKIADKSIADRLRNLEQQNEELQWRFSEAMRAIGLLANKVREIEPFDPTLVEVAAIIASCFAMPPDATPREMNDALRRIP